MAASAAFDGDSGLGISRSRRLVALVATLVWLGCEGGDVGSVVTTGPGGGQQSGTQAIFEIQDEMLERGRPAPDPDRLAFFGDLHVHTTYSFDAYSLGTLATPYDAYRFALGEAIAHPAGFDLQLAQPLDFYAVTDHAMFLGVGDAAGDTTTEFSRHEIALPLNDLNAPDNRGTLSLLGRISTFGNFIPGMVSAIADGQLERETVLDITRSAWRDTIDAADLFNDPGRFTTFVGYEYTTWSEGFGNLHRNVIFEGSDRLPAVPFSRFHSGNPEDLWEWMDALRQQGVESLAIPHNSNGSNGQMFKLVDWAGDPIDDAYAELRIRNEPLVEITQIKGTSETHPLLSTRDEWADFEIMPYRVATMLPSEPAGSYVRDALRRGLALESQGVRNPYDFGLIGSSDTHTGASENDESNFVSKLGLLSATAALRGSVPFPWLMGTALRVAAPETTTEVDGETYVGAASPTYSASGLAAVWAEENTREAIYRAFRRKETFATSGPRIRLRFFAGYDFEPGMLDASDVVARAYAGGVTMGSDLAARAGAAPHFLVWALADAATTPLQRLQIIKGWIDSEGETFERVYDVACSAGAPVDPVTHRCPDNGARVDLSDCSVSGDGAAQLRTLWSDPSFDPDERAFYYARVLENPTCRWSTWDALRADVPPRSDLPTTLQERAWSSPIHYRPAS
ncbi:MAG: DUF3604 domain-containing protein [Myxococcota bacterium]|nr:DUF3604 domain-containing protein [Myxococcota bacterium]MEE2673992.1 DUF3604 domain-containing protein [Myxococcota bacterium]